MVIPTFERSLDLLIDNEFELSDEEIEQFMSILSKDANLLDAIDALINCIEPCQDKDQNLKKTLRDLVQSHSHSIEELYEAIIKDSNLISLIQEILLKRVI
jgi:hypothetical protein